MDLIEASKEDDMLVFKAMTYPRLSFEAPRVDLLAEIISRSSQALSLKRFSYYAPSSWRTLRASALPRLEFGRAISVSAPKTGSTEAVSLSRSPSKTS